VPGVGRDFAFTEFAYKADLNKWSNPVKGTIGVYLINVKDRTPFDKNAFDNQKLSIKKELLQQKKNNYYNAWIQDLKKEADIVDNRYLFYR
ncbi:MAG: hypothetical protein GYA14_13890, partial [Ignavibacteria bacterium]|nr:hypothetical protein [Ignavibacteria bacterium]